MILTEDKTYTISLEQEDCGSTTGLVNKNTELVFSNKELLHAVVTCGMPIQRMTASFFIRTPCTGCNISDLLGDVGNLLFRIAYIAGQSSCLWRRTSNGGQCEWKAGRRDWIYRKRL